MSDGENFWTDHLTQKKIPGSFRGPPRLPFFQGLF